MRILTGVTLLSAALSGPLHAQAADARAPDERLVVVSQNGFIRLAVTDTELRFRFTEAGIRDVEREIDADLADEKPFVRWMAGLVGETVTSVLAGLKVDIDVCTIERVEYDDDHLVFEHGPDRRHHDHGKSRLGPFARRDAQALIRELDRVRSGRCVS